jgi:hypothetical protein
VIPLIVELVSECAAKNFGFAVAPVSTRSRARIQARTLPAVRALAVPVLRAVAVEHAGAHGVHVRAAELDERALPLLVAEGGRARERDGRPALELAQVERVARGHGDARDRDGGAGRDRCSGVSGDGEGMGGGAPDATCEYAVTVQLVARSATDGVGVAAASAATEKRTAAAESIVCLGQ